MTTKTDLSNASAAALLEELCVRLDAGDHLPQRIRIRHDDIIQNAWAIGGVYSDENTRTAAWAIAALVRYLNHATDSDQAVPYLSTADAVISYLHAAATGLEQLLEQLAVRVDTEAHRKSVYNNRDRDDQALAADTLAQLKHQILQCRLAAGQLAASLNHAFENSSNRLGNLTNNDEQIVDREGNRVR